MTNFFVQSGPLGWLRVEVMSHPRIGPGQHRPGQVPLQVMLIIKVMLQFGICITQCKLRVLANCVSEMKNINLNHGLVQCA